MIRASLIVMSLAALLGMLAFPAIILAQDSGTSATEARPPNIILVVTDDQDRPSTEAMPALQELIAAPGATFRNAFVTAPLCCPSQASIFRGQYAHNHGVLRNSPPDGGFAEFITRGNEESTIATWLQSAGYRTGLFGKMLNGYSRRDLKSVGLDRTHVSPGWDVWHTSFTPAYFDYSLNIDGAIVDHGSAPEDYLTDVLAAAARQFIADSVQRGEPFFVYLAPSAPHEPADAAPRHAESFSDATAPRSPAFNEADVADKPAFVRDTPLLSEAAIAELDDLHLRRLRTLLAVDEAIADLVETLETTGILDNTFFFYTSDNGYLTGEHRLGQGKIAPYEESIRVPLFVRGPGIAAGSVIDEIALNIDLAPTLAELAGARAAPFVDGRSLAPLWHADESLAEAWRSAFLVERFAPGGTVREDDEDGSAEDGREQDEESLLRKAPDAPEYRAIRATNWLYVEYQTGEREFYDLVRDPSQLDNRIEGLDEATQRQLSEFLRRFAACAAEECRELDVASPGIPVSP